MRLAKSLLPHFSPLKIPFNYDRAGAFANGKATVETSGDRFVIDRHGRFIEKAPLGL